MNLWKGIQRLPSGAGPADVCLIFFSDSKYLDMKVECCTEWEIELIGCSQADHLPPHQLQTLPGPQERPPRPGLGSLARQDTSVRRQSLSLQVEGTKGGAGL